MSNLRIARRYAEAVMDLAAERDQMDRLGRDLELLQQAIKESREFVAFLKSPVISKEKKQAVLAELFRSRVSDETISFLNLLTAKSREDVLPETIEEFFRLRDERQGIVGVEVRAASELTPDQRQGIQRRFEAITQKKIRIAFVADARVCGGFVAKVGDTVYDGSVRRQLELLRERFVEEIGSSRSVN
ncbi:MAG: ATP synthase F1 subunit delta [Ignavibacteria bacterium]|nr:ATP synthase F1 subunit delta [Ignavibacteria bacterium]